MCCFSGDVDYVKATKIFARGADDRESQFIVYSMQMKAETDVAMILPIPVKRGIEPDAAAKFISLEGYPKFFEEMEKGFPSKSKLKGGGGLGTDLNSIPVVSVGSFDASFVPTLNDFGRLDKRFRLPDGTWDKLPAYADFGFAVFKLKSGVHDVHPMAFQFVRARPQKLFFPTVHIHDGKVHGRAKFDHVLYCQLAEFSKIKLLRWRESPRLPSSFMKIDQTQKIVTPDAHVHRLKMRGVKKNADVWL